MKGKLPPHGSALNDIDNDFDVDLVTPPRYQRQSGAPASHSASLLTVARGMLWLACVGWTVLCLLWYVAKGAGEDSAIRDAATAANACVGIIAGYVICRAIDSATRK